MSDFRRPSSILIPKLRSTEPCQTPGLEVGVEALLVRPYSLSRSKVNSIRPRSRIQPRVSMARFLRPKSARAVTNIKFSQRRNDSQQTTTMEGYPRWWVNGRMGYACLRATTTCPHTRVTVSSREASPLSRELDSGIRLRVPGLRRIRLPSVGFKHPMYAWRVQHRMRAEF